MDSFDFLNEPSPTSFNNNPKGHNQHNDPSQSTNDPFDFDVNKFDQFSSDLSRLDKKYNNEINNNNSNSTNQYGFNMNNTSPFDFSNMGDFEMNNKSNNDTIGINNNNNNGLSQTLNVDDFMSSLGGPQGINNFDLDNNNNNENNNKNNANHNIDINISQAAAFNNDDGLDSFSTSYINNNNNNIINNGSINNKYINGLQQNTNNNISTSVGSNNNIPTNSNSISSSFNGANNNNMLNLNPNSFRSPRVSTSSIMSERQSSTSYNNNPQYFSPSLRPSSLSTSVNNSMLARRSGSISNADNTGRSYSSQLGTSLNNIISPTSTYSGFEDSPYGSYQNSFNDSYLKSPMNSPSFKAIGSPASIGSHMNPKNPLHKETKLNRRRELHNAVERRRRDLIKEKIKELGTLIPPTLLSVLAKSKTGHAKEIKANKSIILNKSVEYISYLQEIMQSQDERLAILTSKIEELQKLSEANGTDTNFISQDEFSNGNSNNNIGNNGNHNSDLNNNNGNGSNDNSNNNNNNSGIDILNIDQFNFNLDDPQFIKQEQSFDDFRPNSSSDFSNF